MKWPKIIVKHMLLTVTLVSTGDFTIASINVLAFKSILSAKAILTDATLTRGLALWSRHFDETAVTPSYICINILDTIIYRKISTFILFNHYLSIPK